MDNVICIYDLAATGKCAVYSFKEEREILSFYIPPALIKKNTQSDGKISQPANFKSSLFDPSSPDYSLFYSYNVNSSTFSYNNDLLLTMSEIIYSLCNDEEVKKPYRDAKIYFESIKKYVNGKIKVKVDRNILLVPDSLPIESQEKLLSYFGKYDTQLLWRSVAIFLGNEYLMESTFNADSIGILDKFSIGMLYSRLGIKRQNSRFIPCHKLYKKADGNLNNNWYCKDFVVNNSQQLETVRRNRVRECYRLQGKEYYPDLTKGGIPQLADDSSSLQSRVNLNKLPSRDQVVLVPKRTSASLRTSFFPVDLNRSAFDGACRYIEYINKGEVPYYDECESFSIVYQTEKEEVKYLELIAVNAELPAGRISQGNKTDKLGIGKGNTELNIYLHLGDKSRSDIQLKRYTQRFPLEHPLDEYRPLLLYPSIMPGQGYAYVRVEDASSDKLFPAIELDFKDMELAFDEKKNPPRRITKQYLETTMERSFPPDVPPVRCRYSCEEVPYDIRRQLERLVKDRDTIYMDMFLNASRWPYINDKDRGVERFVRENVFGTYFHGCKLKDRFPHIGIDEKEYIDCFESIARDYVLSCKRGEPKTELVRWLAWSYQRYDLDGKYLRYAKEATDCLLQYIRDKKQPTLKPEEASYIANMIVTRKEFETVLELFVRRLRQTTVGLSYWCRAIYQLLMYTDFIYSDSDTIGENVHEIMVRLSDSFANEEANYKSENITDLFLRCILYLLRRRVREYSFCRKDTDYILYNKVLGALSKIDGRSYLNKKTIIKDTVKSVRDYLEGKGTLDGIPVPELKTE